MSTKKFEKRVREAAELLLAANGSTTTLNIKNYLRAKYPNEIINQKDVSNAMIAIEKSGILPNLTFNDNGIHREYFFNKAAAKVKANPIKKVQAVSDKISKTAAVNLIKNSKGKFFTVVFVKTDGTERILNGNVKKDKFMNELGYINVKERNGDLRQINPRTLKSVSIGGKTHAIK